MALWRGREKTNTAGQKPATKTYLWHAHSRSEVSNVLGTGNEGLSHEESKKRRRLFGQNKITEAVEPSIFSYVIKEISGPLTLVLLAASLVTVGLGEFVDAVVILVALLLAVVIGVLQNKRSAHTFYELSRATKHVATVFHEGQRHEVDASELVPGDVVEIQGGAYIPADVRLIECKNFAVNESSLTGEWQAVLKNTEPLSVGTPLVDRLNMAYTGSLVTDGYARGVVVATGDDTVLGQMNLELSAIEEIETPLQTEMKSLSRVLFGLILFLVLVVFAFGVVSGEAAGDMLLIAIAIAVASIPEGLPAAVTIVLSITMQELHKKGGLVRNLLAAETLGSTTYILTDKTGTLTEGRMSLVGIIGSGGENFDQKTWHKDTYAKTVLESSLMAIGAYEEDEAKKFALRGDPMEQAILKAAIDSGVATHGFDNEKLRADYLAFSPVNKVALGLVCGEKSSQIYINGVPEYLLEEANRILVDGEIKKINQATKEKMLATINRYAEEGKRLIGISFVNTFDKELGTSEGWVNEIVHHSILLGFLVFDDPLREGVVEAIGEVKNAGVKVMLLTGDISSTALFVARKVGIAGSYESALVGTDIEEMSDKELLAAFENIHTFARVLPHQKMRIAELLQSRGEVVAMTGDGVNDSLALKRANIGVSLGSGTEVAKEASDLVLLKDSFVVIKEAIEEGRRVVANLRKVVGYLLSTSLSEVVLIITALLLGAHTPILPVQILFANLIEEGLMSVAFAFEPAEKGLMKQRPQDVYEEGILSGAMSWFVFFVVMVLSSLIVLLYLLVRAEGLSLEELRSVMFVAISIDSLFIAFAFRSLTTPVWQQSFKSNLMFAGSFLLSFGLLASAMSVPFIGAFLSYEPISLKNIALTAAFGLLSLLVIEFGKWLFLRRG